MPKQNDPSKSLVMLEQEATVTSASPSWLIAGYCARTRKGPHTDRPYKSWGQIGQQSSIFAGSGARAKADVKIEPRKSGFVRQLG